MNSLHHSLVRENKVDLLHRIDKACKSNEEYKSFIASILVHSAILEHTAESETHPIIPLNALKNILSENPSKPSRDILRVMVEILSGKPLRKQKYQDLLLDLKAGGVSGSIFFSDLEDALQRGDRDQALKEAARLYTVSDNPVGVLECITELALQNIHQLGQFIFHLIRAAAFNPTHDNIWLFTCCAVEEITKNSLPDPHDSAPIIIDTIVSYVLEQSNSKLLTDFGAVKRLWDKEYLRSRAFKREISYWLSTLKINETVTNNSKTKTTAALDLGEDLIELQEIQFIKLTEDILSHFSGDISSKLKKIIILIDALRYFAKSNPNQNQAALIRDRIQEIIKQ